MADETYRGGGWLLDETPAGDVLTPESLPEDYRLIGRTAAEFVRNEVEPALDAFERKEWSTGRALLARCGELGLLGTDVPEHLGGIGLDKAAAVVVAEAIGASAAFSTMFGGQTGLAMIPLICFGTPEQQQRYLPRLVTGEIVGAYCLSESGAGSDALSLRTRATRADDGSWLLSGEKMWVTNGGFADLYIVFAKVDGEQVSAFLVERRFAGVSVGNEEHKMGLQGSSTTSVVLADARVPAGNLLGEIGRGHKIAFNVLNYGRFKLGAMCSGGARATIAEAVAYAAARRQFGRPIAAFGAIRHKLAEMAVRLYAVESMLYRTAGLIDRLIGGRHDDPGTVAAALEDFAVEASLVKVAGSEMADFVVDENVQIHGGNGFVRDYPAERRYRDARVNRIFEGTNEINRLLVPPRLLKRAANLPVREAADRMRRRASARPDAGAESAPLDRARQAVSGLKAAALESLGAAASAYGSALGDEQEVVMRISDLLIDAFAAESALLRAERSRMDGHATAALQEDAAATVVHDAAEHARATATVIAEAVDRGPDLDRRLAAISTMLGATGFDTIGARRRIADAVTERKGYVFG